MSQYNGLLIVDKPGKTRNDDAAPPQTESEPGDADRKLPTSHDIVQQVRRWSKERRIGHTGTLDPMASGVLVLCLGVTTRLVEYYQRHDKQYYAEIVLGAATDTYDALGRITQQAPVPQLDEAKIERALAQFRGEVQQVPPLFSALKMQGESLHRKARRGETVALAPRPITFYQLELLAFAAPNRICVRIRCSAGAYIRSLAHDLGQTLHSCAYLDILRREQAGPFGLADAHTLPQIESAIQQQRFAEMLLPLGARLDLPQLTLDEEAHTRLGYGQKTPIVAGPPPVEGLAQAYATDGSFAGIIRCLGVAQDTDSANPATIWKAEKWFNTES